MVMVRKSSPDNSVVSRDNKGKNITMMTLENFNCDGYIHNNGTVVALEFICYIFCVDVFNYSLIIRNETFLWLKIWYTV